MCRDDSVRYRPRSRYVERFGDIASSYVQSTAQGDLQISSEISLIRAGSGRFRPKFGIGFLIATTKLLNSGAHDVKTRHQVGLTPHGQLWVCFSIAKNQGKWVIRQVHATFSAPWQQEEQLPGTNTLPGEYRRLICFKKLSMGPRLAVVIL